MRLLVTPSFVRAAKRLHRSHKADLDEAVRAIREPLIYSSHRRKPVSSALNFLDSGLRRNDELSFNQRFLSTDPEIGEAKVGDLAGVRVYKFRLSNQLCLLAYRVLDEANLKLLTFGPHENFYRDLKRYDD